jgi:hypothetical protein
VTYRQAPIREPIEPPWGRHPSFGRRVAYSLFGAGGAGAVALLALGDPVLAFAALLSSSGIGLSFLFGGGADPREPTAAGQGSADEPLRRAGLQPVGWTEWRAEREGYPVRVLYSALSARVRIEVAVGSDPSFALEVEAPPVAATGVEVVGPVTVRSDQLELGRAIVSSALRRTPDLPPVLTLRLRGRVLETRIDRAAIPSGYDLVLAALDFTLGAAQAMASMGQGLPPFRRA